MWACATVNQHASSEIRHHSIGRPETADFDIDEDRTEPDGVDIDPSLGNAGYRSVHSFLDPRRISMPPPVLVRGVIQPPDVDVAAGETGDTRAEFLVELDSIFPRSFPWTLGIGS